MYSLVCSTIVLLIIGVMCIDLLPVATVWESRIKIGRYFNKNVWYRAIFNKSKKWIKKVPKIKLTDNSRLIFIDILKDNYTKDTIQHWQEAALILGFAEYKRSETDKELEKLITKFINQKINDNGSWINKPKHVDGAILAYSIMKIKEGNINDFKCALDDTWDMIQNYIGNDGTIKYRNTMENYRYIDTIGFVCPFLIKYGLYYQKEECIDLALNQIREYRKNGMLNERVIPYHAYSTDLEVPLGLCGWGRGLGWYAIGVIDSWLELPDTHPHKNELTNYVLEFAKEIIKLQNDNGSWSWTVVRKETRFDSSTTATLGWFLINAAKINEIEEQCHIAVEKSIEYLMSVTRRNGTIDFSQGDTKDIGVYSMLFDALPFTQGFALRTISKNIGLGEVNE